MRHKWLLFLKLCQKVAMRPGLNFRHVYAELLKSATHVPIFFIQLLLMFLARNLRKATSVPNVRPL
jgi:hypothetical protein